MPSPHTSRENLIKAKASPNYRRPRLWRSPRESHCVRVLVYEWMKTMLPLQIVAPLHVGDVDENGYVVTRFGGDRISTRRLAKQLGVSKTWILKLKRRFESQPPRQGFGRPLTLAELHDEQTLRRGDYRYRPPRIRREHVAAPAVLKDGMGNVLYDVGAARKRVEELLKKLK